MRMAIFSDIHGNLEAMEAFLEHALLRKIDRYICLGDIVGYGANPSECIQLVQSLPNLAVLLGNHDAAIHWQSSPYMMNEDAKEAILWCMERLDDDEKKFLAGLPLTHCFNDINFSHANPRNPEGWHYVNNRKYALRSLNSCDETKLFVGHTHMPLIATRKSLFHIKFEKPELNRAVEISTLKRQIFNCGSIGQPRTGCPKANYLIFDTRKGTVTYYAVPYDYELAARKIISAGLPETLANRLKRGV